MFVAEGINDSKGIGSPQTPKTPLENFRQNIRKLIEMGKKYTKTLIFMGPTPINENKTAPTGDNYFLNSNIKKYNNVIKDICKKENITFVELLTDWDKVDYKNFLLVDGIHPNKTGHQKIFEKVKCLIND
ncbi:MAG: GDSL-type esterase/lipase family protein [bacterium]